MRCRECEHSRMHSQGAVWCVEYGIYIRADHECSLEGRRKRERTEDGSHKGEDEAEVWSKVLRAAGEVPGVLAGSGA